MHEWPRLNPHRQRHVERLRRTGVCVLAACIAIAILVYRYGVANYSPTVEDLLPNTAASIERQRGILFGPGIAQLMGWFDLLRHPAGQAVLIVLAGIIGTAAFYQVAHAIEVEEG